MSGPAQVRVKRKRDEPAPDTLVVEQQQQPQQKKRALTDQLRYVLQAEQAATGEDAAKQQVDPLKNSKAVSTPISRSRRRVFHLKRPRNDHAAKEAKTRTGRVEEMLATFEERPTHNAPASTVKPAELGSTTSSVSAANATPLKRPGKSSVLSSKPTIPSNVSGIRHGSDPKRMESMADQLHQFALAEISRPKVVATPKFAGRRRQVSSAQGVAPEPQIRDEEMMDDDSDYVYDTYVLAATGATTVISVAAIEEGGNVGYLVITDEDQALWEEYMDDEGSDQEFDTDDEDENAEDYYGADYPEDELASDDEYGRNAYGYRANGASDDEEWDEDTGSYSDDETADPWDRRR